MRNGKYIIWILLLVGFNVLAQFDVSVAKIKGKRSLLAVNGQESAVSGVVFNTTGNKMFTIGSSSDRVKQYSLTTNFDIGTATYDGTAEDLVISTRDNTPVGLCFNNDGSKLFVVGDQNNSVFCYSLSTNYDVSTGTFLNSFSVNSQSTTPTGIRFNPTGTVMMIASNSSDRIIQYNLTTGFDLSTASYASKFINTATASPSGAAETNPQDVLFDNTGNYLYIIGYTTDTVFTYYLSTAYDLGSVSFQSTKKINIASEFPTSTGFCFNDNGTKLFITDSDRETVSQYKLTTAYEVNTAVYESVSKYVDGAKITSVLKAKYSHDGTKLFVLGPNGANDYLIQYNLNNAYEVFKGNYAGDAKRLNLATQDTNPFGFSFNTDGTKLYVCGQTNDRVYQYNLSTAYDLSTATYINFASISQDNTSNDIRFNNDGTKMYMLGSTNDRIYQYSLSTAWDITTLTYGSVFKSVSAQDTNPRGFDFNNDGTKLFIVGESSDKIHEYTLGTAFDLSGTLTYAGAGETYNVGRESSAPMGIDFNANGTGFIIAGNETDAIYTYTIVDDFVTIPDTNFKNYLLGVIDVDGDGQISIYETDFHSSTMNVNGLSIANLTGIGNFKNVSTLNCSNNGLTTLNVSALSSLTSLNCSNNSLTSLYVNNGINSLMSTANFNSSGNNNPCIVVDDLDYSYVNWTNKDSASSFGSNCTNLSVAAGVTTINSNVSYYDIDVADGGILMVDPNVTLTVFHDVNTNTTGSIRLKGSDTTGPAQLIQTRYGVNNNPSTATIHQEVVAPDKSSQYQFVYASSPTSVNGSTYNVASVLKDARLGADRLSDTVTGGTINFISNDSDGIQSGAGTTISNNWIYGYLNGTDGNAWTYKGSSGNFNIGEGYSMKVPGGDLQRYIYAGRPNNGDYSFSLTANGRNSLLGNPYPSAIDADELLTDNPSASTLYFYEDNSSSHYQTSYEAGYGTYVIGVGTAASTGISGTAGLGSFSYTAPGRYIPVGQGFMVESSVAGGTFTFKNKHRAATHLGGTSKLFQVKGAKTQQVSQSSSIPYLKIGVESNIASGEFVHRQLALTFVEGNDGLFNNGYDAYLYDEKPNDAYFLTTNHKKLVINSVGAVEETMEIPLVVSVTDYANEVYFMIDENHLPGYEVYLYDAKLNTYDKLHAGVVVKQVLKEVSGNRFSIRFKKDADLGMIGVTPHQFAIVYDKNTIKVSHPTQTISKLTLIDIAGKKIEEVLGDEMSIKLPLQGIYVLQMMSEYGIETQKVILN